MIVYKVRTTKTSTVMNLTTNNNCYLILDYVAAKYNNTTNYSLVWDNKKSSVY